MKVKFVGDPRFHDKDGRPQVNEDGRPIDDTPFIRVYGIGIKLGETVDVSHLKPEEQAKLAGNKHFVVVSGEAPRIRHRLREAQSPVSGE